MVLAIVSNGRQAITNLDRSPAEKNSGMNIESMMQCVNSTFSNRPKERSAST